MSLTVNIPNTFSGPMDLLFSLIRRDEMDIYDINIAKLANSYLEEMRKLDIVDVDEAAEFLDLASRLLEIKSRMLVPPDERDEQEEDDEDFDPRAGLVEALLEYRRFKDAARKLGEMAEEQTRRYPRIAPKMHFQFVGEEIESAGSEDLFLAFQSMLLKMMPENESNVITYTEIPTSIRIQQIQTVLLERGATRFSLLLSGAPNRQEMVGFFIAMLEMIRQGRLVARQADNFSDIILEYQEPIREKQAGEKPARRVYSFRAFPAAVPARKTAVRKSGRIVLFSPISTRRAKPRRKA